MPFDDTAYGRNTGRPEGGFGTRWDVGIPQAQQQQMGSSNRPTTKAPQEQNTTPAK